MHSRLIEGKSARVKQIDSDCEIIYMRNATQKNLNGKSVYVFPLTKKVSISIKKTVILDKIGVEENIDTYEYVDEIVKEEYMLDIKPTWLVKIEEKCKK